MDEEAAGREPDDQDVDDEHRSLVSIESDRIINKKKKAILSIFFPLMLNQCS